MELTQKMIQEMVSYIDLKDVKAFIEKNPNFMLEEGKETNEESFIIDSMLITTIIRKIDYVDICKI